MLQVQLARIDGEGDKAEALGENLILYDRGVVPNVDGLNCDSRHLSAGKGEGHGQRAGKDGEGWARRGELTSEMMMRRRALATLASTPTRSNSKVEGLSELSETRRFELKWSKSQ